jgi:cold shock CspA family protein
VTIFRSGRVIVFDALEGLGVVRDEGGSELPFHCVAITDGTRQIEVGRAVLFVVRPGSPGQWEAGALEPLPGRADLDLRG